jgi:glycerophosphoryl diester phosphodiesterase
VLHPFLDADAGRPRAIAHRGGRHGGPENTLPAFAAAVALGYRHLETDVHATADGRLVISHDPTLMRVAGRPGEIGRMTAADVAAVRIDGETALPRFEELLDAFPDALVTVDLKVDAAVAPMLRLLARRPALLERLCLGAFSQRRIAAVRSAHGRSACTAAAPREVLALLTAVRLGRRVRPSAADLVAVPERWGGDGVDPVRGPRVADARLLARATETGLAVHVWTVNDPDRMRRLLDLGASGLVTDETERLRDVLRERGAWGGTGGAARG